jgi:hypothetical protein
MFLGEAMALSRDALRWKPDVERLAGLRIPVPVT